MLVLTRRVSETIVIAGDIHVTVLGVRGNQVRIGITAPADIPVVRRELLVPQNCVGFAADARASQSP